MKDSLKIFFWSIGFPFVFISLVGMLLIHEFLLSGILFILGIIFVGFAFADPPHFGKININQINKNVQNYNDALWGKQKEPVKEMNEYDWQNTIQNQCIDIRKRFGGNYCVYGCHQGYCRFEKCPRRKK